MEVSASHCHRIAATFPHLPSIGDSPKMRHKSSQSSVLSEGTSSPSTSINSENSSPDEGSTTSENSDEDEDDTDDSEDAVCAPSDPVQHCQTGRVTSNGDSKSCHTAVVENSNRRGQKFTDGHAIETLAQDPDDAAYDEVDLISESDEEDHQPELGLLAMTNEIFPEYTLGDLSTYTDPAVLAWDIRSSAFSADMVFDEPSQGRYSEVSLADFPISSPPMTPIASRSPAPAPTSLQSTSIVPTTYLYEHNMQVADADCYSESGTTENEYMPHVETTYLQNIHPRSFAPDATCQSFRQPRRRKIKPKPKMLPRRSFFNVDPSCAMGQPGEKCEDIVYSMPLVPSSHRCLPSEVSACFLPRVREPPIDYHAPFPPILSCFDLDPTISAGTDTAMADLIDGAVNQSSPPNRTAHALPDFVPANSQFLKDLAFQEANSDHESTDLDISEFMHLDEDSSNSDDEAKCLKLWDTEDTTKDRIAKERAALLKVGPLTPSSSHSQSTISKVNADTHASKNMGAKRKRKSCEIQDVPSRPNTRLRSHL